MRVLLACLVLLFMRTALGLPLGDQPKIQRTMQSILLPLSLNDKQFFGEAMEKTIGDSLTEVGGLTKQLTSQTSGFPDEGFKDSECS